MIFGEFVKHYEMTTNSDSNQPAA